MIYSFKTRKPFIRKKRWGADLTDPLRVSATPRWIRHTDRTAIQLDGNDSAREELVRLPNTSTLRVRIPRAEMNQFISDRDDLSGTRVINNEQSTD